MNYANLIQNITENIKTNGSQAITAQVLQDVLVDMVQEMGQAGGLVYGVVDTNFVPTASDSNLIYIAAEPGVYAGFGNLAVAIGEMGLFVSDGNGGWTKYGVDICTYLKEEVDALNTLLEVSEVSVQSPNIFDKSTVVNGYYLNAKVENPVANSTYWYSQKINVTPGKIIIYNDPALRFYFHMYDQNGDFVAATNANNQLSLLAPAQTSYNRTTWSYFTVPSGIYQMQFSATDQYLEDAVFIQVDNVSEIANYDINTYYPYGNIEQASSAVINRIAGIDGITDNPGTSSSLCASQKLVSEMVNASPLKGKKIIAIGDSMVYGNTVGTANVWTALLAEQLGADYVVSSAGQTTLTEKVVVNAGVNGVCLSDNNAPFSTNRPNAVYNRYSGMDNDADYVIVFAGSNDAWALYRNEITMGADTSADPTEFNGAMNMLCQGLLSKYPAKKIAFITPYLAPSADAGATARKTIVEAIKAGCARNGGIPCFDNSTIGGICFDNAAQTTALTQGDGIHLSQDGHAWVVSKYKSFFETL